MRYRFKCAVSAVFIGFSLLCALPVSASETDENATLKSMITELEEKIKSADKRMVAHPNFLQELQSLVDKYKARLRELFFRDAFDDGNFSENPKWTVRSGSFAVNEAGRLTSFVAAGGVKASPQATDENKKSVEAEAVGILLDSIFGAPKKKEPVGQAPESESRPVEPASIYTQKGFPPAFEMTMKFKSSPEGKMDIVLLGGQNLSPRYRLKVNADHSASEPMEVIREGGSRSFVVGAADKFPALGSGRFHTLTWIRHADGAMNVAIDGDVVLKTYEVYHRDSFTGFEITNNGGSFEWDSVEIFKPVKPQTN